MGPAMLNFKVYYKDGAIKTFKVHISKDQNEADGMIMAIRAGKAEKPNVMLTGVLRVVYDEEG